MYYLKFVGEAGAEHNISGYAYNVLTRKESIMVIVNVRDIKGVFEQSFMVGNTADWSSVFIMNINGLTIDKHCFRD